MKQETENKLDEMLRDALQEAAYAEREPSFADRDAFQNWLEEGRCRRNLARRRKIRCAGLAAAAVFLCVFLLSGSLFFLSDSLPPSLQNLLKPDEGIATPDWNVGIESENNSIIIGGDGNGNTSVWTATFTSYDDIPEKYREQIIWFEDMPEGYELAHVEITRNFNSLEYVSCYKKQNEIILLVKHTLYENVPKEVKILNDFTEEFLVEGLVIYKKKTEDGLTYCFIEDKNEVAIFDCIGIEGKKIEAMIASARTGWNKW